MKPARLFERMLDPEFFFKVWVFGMSLSIALAAAAIVILAHFISKAW